MLLVTCCMLLLVHRHSLHCVNEKEKPVRYCYCMLLNNRSSFGLNFKGNYFSFKNKKVIYYLIIQLIRKIGDQLVHLTKSS